MTLANPLVGRSSQHMSLLLSERDRGAWFDGSAGLMALQPYEQRDYYLERTDEPWSAGTPPASDGL